jgi:hypothetical protein
MASGPNFIFLQSRVTQLGKIYLQLLRDSMLMTIKYRSNPNYQNIFLTNYVSTFCKCISGNTSETICDCSATTTLGAQHTEKQEEWILGNCTDN